MKKKRKTENFKVEYELRSNSVEVSQVKNKDTCGTDLGDYLTVAKKKDKSKARVMTPQLKSCL